MMGSKSATLLGGLAAMCLASSSVQAAAITYSDRTAFEATLGASVTDDYSAPGYATGDNGNLVDFDIHSDASMSAVFGETVYQSTGFAQHNIVLGQPGDPFYCAGCNGSFTLSFASTSVGDADGVFGVGFDFFNTGTLYHAFVTFADLTTLDVPLPAGGSFLDPSAFFAITSDVGILSIALGLADGGATASGLFGIDNLTIGAQVQDVPEPASLALFGAGLAALGLARRRRAG